MHNLGDWLAQHRYKVYAPGETRFKRLGRQAIRSLAFKLIQEARIPLNPYIVSVIVRVKAHSEGRSHASDAASVVSDYDGGMFDDAASVVSPTNLSTSSTGEPQFSVAIDAHDRVRHMRHRIKRALEERHAASGRAAGRFH